MVKLYLLEMKLKKNLIEKNQQIIIINKMKQYINLFIYYIDIFQYYQNLEGNIDVPTQIKLKMDRNELTDEEKN